MFKKVFIFCLVFIVFWTNNIIYSEEIKVEAEQTSKEIAAEAEKLKIATKKAAEDTIVAAKKAKEAAEVAENALKEAEFVEWTDLSKLEATAESTRIESNKLAIEASDAYAEISHTAKSELKTAQAEYNNAKGEYDKCYEVSEACKIKGTTFSKAQKSLNLAKSVAETTKKESDDQKIDSAIIQWANLQNEIDWIDRRITNINNSDLTEDEKTKAKSEAYSQQGELIASSTSFNPAIIKHEQALSEEQSAKSDLIIKKSKWYKWVCEKEICTDAEKRSPEYEKVTKNLQSAEEELEKATKAVTDAAKDAQTAIDWINDDINTNNEILTAAKEAYLKTDAAKWDITSIGYEIKVDSFSPGMKVNWKTTKENVNFALATIIQNMMIALWSLALLIMTAWAWYIILHNGQDELLSKWKSIFMSGVYALVVALSSYYLINIIRFILYQWN